MNTLSLTRSLHRLASALIRIACRCESKATAFHVKRVRAARVAVNDAAVQRIVAHQKFVKDVAARKAALDRIVAEQEKAVEEHSRKASVFTNAAALEVTMLGHKL